MPDPEITLVLKVTGPGGTDNLIALVSETPLNLLDADFKNQAFFELDRNNQELLNKVSKNIQKAENMDIVQKQVQYLIQ